MVDGNSYSFDYKVAGETNAYQIKIIAPTVLAAKEAQRYAVSANFFMGTAGDKVECRFDNGPWKEMSFVNTPDPAYQYEVLKFDNATSLMDGRRPSTAVNSSHLWQMQIPNKLAVGKHTIEVRATDRYGKTHTQKSTIDIVE